MNDLQYYRLCKIFKKELDDTELKKLGFSPRNEKFDDDLEYDLHLFEMDQRRKRNDS